MCNGMMVTLAGFKTIPLCWVIWWSETMSKEFQSMKRFAPCSIYTPMHTLDMFANVLHTPEYMS